MAFKVGDKVRHRSFGKGEIAFGPFEHYNGPDHYLMRDEDGKHVLVRGDAMAPAAKFEVGDRVKSFAATYTVEAGPFFAPSEWYALKSDRTGDVLHSDADGLSLVAPEPAKNVAVVDGVTYDLSARYRDADGDVWSFERHADGEIRGDFGDHPRVNQYSNTLRVVLANHGPLVRV